MTGLFKQAYLSKRSPFISLEGNDKRNAQRALLKQPGIAQEGIMDSIKKFFAPYGDEAEMKAYHLGIRGWLRSAEGLKKQLERKVELPPGVPPLQLKGSTMHFMIGEHLIPNEDIAKELGRINELCELFATEFVPDMDKYYEVCTLKYILPAIYFRYNEDMNWNRTLDFQLPKSMLDMITVPGARSAWISRGGFDSDHLMGNWFLWSTGRPQPTYKVDLFYVLTERTRVRETSVPCLTKEQCIDILDRITSILTHCELMTETNALPGHKKLVKAMDELYNDNTDEEDMDYADFQAAWSVGDDLLEVGNNSLRAGIKASTICATLLKFVELSIRRMV